MLCQARVRQPNFQINIFVQKHMFNWYGFSPEMDASIFICGREVHEKRVSKTVAISFVLFSLFYAQN